jgi:hypothetical protein
LGSISRWRRRHLAAYVSSATTWTSQKVRLGLGAGFETIFDWVIARRREFRCLLGNRPEWQADEIDSGESGPPIDVELSWTRFRWT